MEQFKKFMPLSQVNYHIHISLKNSYIYFEVPKVACSTIKATLQKLELGQLERNNQLIDTERIHNKKSSPLLSPSDIGWEKFENMLKDDSILKFCFVRQPYTRVLSAYLSKITWNGIEKQQIAEKLYINVTEKINFSDFVRGISRQSVWEMNPHWREQSSQVFLPLVKYSFIGRFENFDNDFSSILKKIFGESKTQEIVNIKQLKPEGSTHAGTKIENYYDEKTRKLIYSIYEKDFLNFQYNQSL